MHITGKRPCRLQGKTLQIIGKGACTLQEKDYSFYKKNYKLQEKDSADCSGKALHIQENILDITLKVSHSKERKNCFR